MEEVYNRIRAAGPNPQALWKPNWVSFGDGLSKDLGLPKLFSSNQKLGKTVKKHGGVAAIWRGCFPEAAVVASLRYGPPGVNTNLMKAQHMGQPMNSSFAQPMMAPMYPTQHMPQAVPSSFPQPMMTQMPSGFTHHGPPMLFSQPPQPGMVGSSPFDAPWTSRSDSLYEVPRKSRRGRSSSAKRRRKDISPDSSSRSPSSKQCRRVKRGKLRSRSKRKTKQPSQRRSKSSASSSPQRRGRSRSAESPDNLTETDCPNRSHSAPPVMPAGQPCKIEELDGQIHNIWIVVGDDCLISDFEHKVQGMCQTHQWHYIPVALPARGLVLHSGSAVAGIVRYLDDGALERLIFNVTNHKVSDDFTVSCAISEDALHRWPRSATEEPWKLRVDNISRCIHPFTVDGKSTRSCSSSDQVKDEKLLRSAFHKFIFMGPSATQGCFGEVDVGMYRKRLCRRRTAALTDNLLVDQIWYAWYYMPNRAPNGFRLANVLDAVDEMASCIHTSHGDGPGTLIILLTPHGHNIHEC
eukprot:487377-Karenia_brevis.AAC.1